MFTGVWPAELSAAGGSALCLPETPYTATKWQTCWFLYRRWSRCRQGETGLLVHIHVYMCVIVYTMYMYISKFSNGKSGSPLMWKIGFFCVCCAPNWQVRSESFCIPVVVLVSLLVECMLCHGGSSDTDLSQYSQMTLFTRGSLIVFRPKMMRKGLHLGFMSLQTYLTNLE